MKLRTRFEWLPDALTVMRALTGRVLSEAPGDVVYSLSEQMAWNGEASDVQTARTADRLLNPAGADLDAAIADLPMAGRKAATKARCNVTFYLDASAALPVTVPAGTKVRSGSSGPVYAAAVGAILETSGIIACEAAAAGSAQRVAAGDINALTAPVAGIASVSNAADSTGGTDAETDAELLARRTAFWDALTKGTASAYEQFALAVPGVTSAGLMEDWPAPGECTLSVCGGQGSADSAMLAAAAQAIETGGPPNAPGCRTAGVMVRAAAPVRLLMPVTVSVVMRDGYKAAGYKAAIQQAAAAAMAAYGIGARLPLSALGAAIEAAVEQVQAVSAIAAESVEMPQLLPVRILSVGGAPLASTSWEWDWTNTRLRWAGGAWLNTAQLAAGTATLYSADGKSSVTAGIEPYVSGGNAWPRYSLEETTARAALAGVAQLAKNQVFVLGTVSVLPAATAGALEGAA